MNSYPGKQDAMEGGKPANYDFYSYLTLVNPTPMRISGALSSLSGEMHDLSSAALLLLGRRVGPYFEFQRFILRGLPSPGKSPPSSHTEATKCKKSG